MTQVLFLHIPKCGGSSLRHMLSRVYPYASQYPVPIAQGKKTEAYRTQPYTVPQVIENIKQTNVSNFDLFMGHYDWQTVSLIDDDAIVLTMLRDPIQQLYSMFRYFWIDIHNYCFYKTRYEASGFEGFINHPEHVYLFANQQTRFLSGRYYNHNVSDLNNGVLTYAKKNLKRCVYGLVERWDESIELFEDSIGQRLPTGVIENFNNLKRAEPLQDRVMDAVSEIQSFDLSLYDYAAKHFEEQLK